MFKCNLIAIATLTLFSLMADATQGIRIKVTAGEQTMIATFEDNDTTREIISRLPLTLPMQDLYSREMCYRFPDALPANETKTSGYEVGDIVYWAPRHSFVIMYKQNGEKISHLQKIGKINSGVDIFQNTGDIDVKFELDNTVIHKEKY